MSARNADRHVLYQKACQAPDTDIRFLDRVFREEFGRPPMTLREDFCGTAHFCCEWVKSRRGREAWGVDLDPEALAWGREHNLPELDGRAPLVHLTRGNVVRVRSPKVDVQVAFNFSYWVFKTRPALLRYFRAARASMAREGMFVLDLHGGHESSKECRERRGYRTFTYVWDQARFNPIDHDILCHIHFEFPDGSRLWKAFTYDWRWWTLMEVRDALLEAGFTRTEVFWEGSLKGTLRGNGVFRHATHADADPSWVVYIVAF